MVGKFVEFYGAGLDNLSAGRPGDASPTWRPEYGATCGIFPIDRETRQLPGALERAGTMSRSRWWRPTPRRRGCGARQAFARSASTPPRWSLDLGDVVTPSLAGPQAAAGPDRAGRMRAAQLRAVHLDTRLTRTRRRRWRRHGCGAGCGYSAGRREDVRDWPHGAVVIAAITSVHQYLEPHRHAGCGPGGKKSRRTRAQGEALGQDLARTGLDGGH